MTRFLRFTLTFVLKYASTILLTCPLPAHAQRAAVTIYGEAIVEDEIEQRTKLDVLVTHKRPERQDVIKELVDDKDKIKEAEKIGVDLANAKVDSSFAEMCSRMHVAPEQLAKSLGDQGIQLETLKNRIKADMARASLARQRYYRFQDPHDKFRDPYFKHQDPPLFR